jgi:hypothetical protein
MHVLYSNSRASVECQNNSNTNNNTDNWNYPKSFRKHLNDISEKHRKLKETVTLGTGHIFRNVSDKICTCDDETFKTNLGNLHPE